MDEEVKAAETAVKAQLSADLLDPSITDSFVDESWIAVNEATVSILFGTRIPGTDKAKPVFRAFISHAAFLSFMNLWEKRRTFLLKAYGNAPVSLNDMDQERIAELFAEMVKVD